jgi:hypothetical protein
MSLTGICAMNFADTLDAIDVFSTFCASSVFTARLLSNADPPPDETINKFLLVYVRGMLDQS